MKIKKLALGVCISCFVIGSSIYVLGLTSEKPAKEEKLIKDSELADEYQTFEGADKATEKAPFKIKKFNNIPEDLVEDKTEYKSNKNKLGSISLVETFYKPKSGTDKYMRIIQANDTGKPLELLDQCEKLSLNGIDAWSFGSEEGQIQIMFWVDGKYYNVIGSGISKDKLVKVAESLEK